MCTPTEMAALTKALNSASDAASLCSKLTAVEELNSTITALSDTLAGTAAGLNIQYLIWAGALVFIMHGGFAMLCAGAIRSKNSMNILLQTILDACVSAIAFYLVGYGFAYGWGEDKNQFIGSNLFALARYTSRNGEASTGLAGWTPWFYQWAFAATATTIPAGAVAERFNFNAYLGYSVLISSFVYPVVVRWAWSNQGWLGAWNSDKLFDSGYIDFAGSGVVHMVGGLSGLMGAIFVGPRLGRFDQDGNPNPMPGHSATLVVLGTCLLWFGWYGFNPGSTLAINTLTYGMVASRAATTTTLSGAAGGITALVAGFFRGKVWDVCALCNGALVGFVSITAGCHVVEPWAAILIGAVGAVIFDAVCALLLKLKIDDPLSASPMHGFCGAWGVLAVGLLAKKEYIIETYYATGAPKYWGAFYSGGGGNLFACQLVGVLAITAWVCGIMGVFFFILGKLNLLRISEADEHAGLDASKHGGQNYNHDHGLPEKAAI